jgi:hypothetical protein
MDMTDKKDFTARPENKISPVRETDAGPKLYNTSFPWKGIKTAVIRMKGVITRERFSMCPAGMRDTAASKPTIIP